MCFTLIQRLGSEDLYQSDVIHHSEVAIIYSVQTIRLTTNQNVCVPFYNPTPPPLPVLLGFNSHESYAIRYLLKKYNNFAVTVSSAGDCFNGCQCRSMHLFQLVDIKIAGYRHDQSGRANISGSVAMRDTVEPLRNYVYKRDVNNCEAISVNRKTVMPFSWKSVVDFNPFCNHGTVFLLTNSRG